MREGFLGYTIPYMALETSQYEDMTFRKRGEKFQYYQHFFLWHLSCLASRHEEVLIPWWRIELGRRAEMGGRNNRGGQSI
jgi:hypothetical protein